MIRDAQDPWFWPVDQASVVGDIVGDSLIDVFNGPTNWFAMATVDGKRFIRTEGGVSFQINLESPCSAMAFGIRMLKTGGPNQVVDFRSGSTVIARLDIGAGWRVYRGAGSVLLATGDLPYRGGWAQYAELDMKFDPAAGDFQLYVDGVADPVAHGTAVNTGSGPIDNLLIYGGQGGPQYEYFRDIYFMRRPASGPHVLGPILISHNLPNADGGQNDGTPSTGTNHYAVVDEAVNSTGDYLDLTAVGQKERFAKAGLATAYRIVGAGVVGVANNVAGGTDKLRPYVRVGGTDYSAADVAPGNTVFGGFSQSFATNPATGQPWTAAEWNAAQVGVEAT